VQGPGNAAWIGNSLLLSLDYWSCDLSHLGRPQCHKVILISSLEVPQRFQNFSEVGRYWRSDCPQRWRTLVPDSSMMTQQQFWVALRCPQLAPILWTGISELNVKNNWMTPGPELGNLSTKVPCQLNFTCHFLR
jgi:hypothetical protein